MNHELNIQDVSKVTITKVTPWKINFRYEDRRYCIRLLNINQKQDKSGVSGIPIILDCVSGRIISNSTDVMEDSRSVLINEFIVDISKRFPRSIVYSNINKDYFVRVLTKYGVKTLYSEKYKELEHKRYRANAIILRAQQEIEEADKKFFDKSGHAKLYDPSVKIKASERIIKEAHKVGEYCELYDDYYGNTHKVYGGVLTDLRGLPYGTYFRCCNGGWDGVISYDDHGDKVVVPLGSDICSNKLSEKYHALYIELPKKEED